MKDKWNIFHITFIINVVILFFIEIDKASSIGRLTMNTIVYYLLFVILGVIALAAWRNVDKYALYLNQKCKYSQKWIIVVRNISELIIVLIWSYSQLFIINKVGVYKIQFGLQEVFITAVISVLIVGIVSILYCRWSCKVKS